MNSKYLTLCIIICTLGIAIPGMYNVDAATHHNNDPCFFEKMKPLKWLCKSPPPDSPDPPCKKKVYDPVSEGWECDDPVCIVDGADENNPDYVCPDPVFQPVMKCIQMNAKQTLCYKTVKPAPPNCIWIDKANEICSYYQP